MHISSLMIPVPWMILPFIIAMALLNYCGLAKGLNVTQTGIHRHLNDDRSKPRAVIHLGPRCVGNQFFFNFLMEHADALEAHNFFFPKLDDTTYFDIKAMNAFFLHLKGSNSAEDVYALLHEDELATASRLGSTTNSHHHRKSKILMERKQKMRYTATQMKLFLQDSVILHRNVILVSDYLTNLSIMQLDLLFRIFEDFDITVIATYREMLSHFIAIHHALSLNIQHPLPPFLNLLFRELSLKSFLIGSSIAGSVELLGATNVIVLDHYGMEAARIHPVHVVLCEIMGIMCLETASLNEGDQQQQQQYSFNHREYRGQNWVARQMLDVLRSVVQQRGRGFDIAPKAMNKVFQMLQGNLTTGNQAISQLPVLSTDLQPLKIHSIAYDEIMRRRFGRIFRYANQSANALAMSTVTVKYILSWRIAGIPFWKKWLRDHVSMLKAKNWIIKN